MKLLKYLINNTDKDLFKNIVILHINHCISNSFYFNDIISNLCCKLFFVVPPYNNRIPPSDVSYTSYYALMHDEVYTLMRNDNVIIKKKKFL